MKTLTVPAVLTDAEVKALGGTLLDDQSFDVLVQHEDTAVLKPDGSPLLIYRADVLPASVCLPAFETIRHIPVGSMNRGMAAGRLDQHDGTMDAGPIAHRTATRYRPRLLDGGTSRTTYARWAPSGVIGYMDRSQRFPYCRQTAFTAKQFTKYRRVLPFIRAVDGVFRETLPSRYAAQAEAIGRTSPDFVIAGTVFTTATVNHDWQSAVHQDDDDLRAGFGVMAVLDAGSYTGGYLVFPQYRVAVDMRARGVCLADVHEWHGNTPIVGTPGRFHFRASVVLYMRERMTECGTADEERRHGQSVFSRRFDRSAR